jgi:hypothetical protein
MENVHSLMVVSGLPVNVYILSRKHVKYPLRQHDPVRETWLWLFLSLFGVSSGFVHLILDVWQRSAVDNRYTTHTAGVFP